MRLRIASQTLTDLLTALLATSPEESGAFLSVEPSAGDLTLRSFDVFRKEELDFMPGGVALKEEAKVARLVDAKRRGHAVIDVHTHPLSGRDVRFSGLDMRELPAFAKYVRLKIPGRPFGALVLGREGYQGFVWGGSKRQQLLVQALGEAAAMPALLGPRNDQLTESPDRPIYDRQVRALGPVTQEKLSQLRVGIVGLGGTGSLVVQQLAHLGVKNFVLADDDLVEWSNLSRLAGGTWRDAETRQPKTMVARRMIRSIAPHAKIKSVGTLRSTETLNSLLHVDLIIGSVDNDGARLILTELAASRLLPYLDLGVSVDARPSDGLLLGGRISFFIPGGPCLACGDELDFEEAAEDLETVALGALRRERGYARDRRIEPALMPLNSAVVSHAMIEFLAFIGGFRVVERFLRYDATRQKLVKQNVRRNALCPVCIPAEGMGDRQQLNRYSLSNGTVGGTRP